MMVVNLRVQFGVCVAFGICESTFCIWVCAIFRLGERRQTRLRKIIIRKEKDPLVLARKKCIVLSLAQSLYSILCTNFIEKVL